MKKKLLFFAMGLLAFASNTMANNDIYFTADCVDIMQGKKAAIRVFYDAEEDAIFKGFQMEFILPEGFKQAPGARLGAELSANNPELNLRTSERNDGNERPTNVYLGFQVDRTRFPVGEGIELFTFYVQCEEGVELGDYSFTTTCLTLSDMKTGTDYKCEQKTMTLRVVEYQPRRISEDDTDLPEASMEYEDIIVNRTIKADTWSTLTLPFDLDGDKVVEIFGDDVQIAEFVDYDKNEMGQYVVNFKSIEAESGLESNYPYIIKTKNAMTEFCARDVIVNADEDDACIYFDNGKPWYYSNYEWYASMNGTLRYGITVPVNGFFLRNNKFYVSGGNSVLQGLRAYFIIKEFDYLGTGSSNISFMVDGEQTAIEDISVNGNEIVSGDVFSVDGTFRGRAEEVVNSLPRGIYIVNNKKLLVK